MFSLSTVDEDDLYHAMDWLGPKQAHIADQLAKEHFKDGMLVPMMCHRLPLRERPALFVNVITQKMRQGVEDSKSSMVLSDQGRSSCSD